MVNPAPEPNRLVLLVEGGNNVLIRGIDDTRQIIINKVEIENPSSRNWAGLLACSASVAAASPDMPPEFSVKLFCVAMAEALELKRLGKTYAEYEQILHNDPKYRHDEEKQIATPIISEGVYESLPIIDPLFDVQDSPSPSTPEPTTAPGSIEA